MRIHKAIVLLALVAIVAWGTAATDDEPIKIGVVDIDQAISSTDEGKEALKELERRKRQAAAEIQPLGERIKALEEEIKAKKFVLSDEALFQKQMDLKEYYTDYKAKAAELEGKMKLHQERVVGPLMNKLGEIIEEIGKGQSFTLILSRGAPGFLYTREALDVTDLVIEKYNQKS
jgi:outer membrane protein